LTKTRISEQPQRTVGDNNDTYKDGFQESSKDENVHLIRKTVKRIGRTDSKKEI